MIIKAHSKVILWLIIIAGLGIIVNNYDCSTAMTDNMLTNAAWTRCYQAADHNIIGNTVGSFSSNWFGQSAAMAYNDYSSITFIATTTTAVQRWNYRYHITGATCGNGGVTCSCDAAIIINLQDGTSNPSFLCYNCLPADCSGNACINCNYNTDYYEDNSVTTVVYLPCHYLCTSCTASWDKTACQSCGNLNGDAYQWLQWGSATVYIDTCDTVCPNDNNRGYDNAYPGQYIAVASSRYCQQCSTLCSVCQDLSDGSLCQVCVSGAALIANHDECMTDFPNDNGDCLTNNQCVSGCPANLYFLLTKSLTSDPAYIFTATHALGTVRKTNVCYLCHTYCKQCSDQYDNTCTACSYGYYLWQQYTTRCNYYCTEGQYTSGGLKGEFFNPLTSNTNRACATCSVGCQSCANSASECYTCQDDYFLLDDKTQCLSKFTCPLCVDPTYATDGCASNDKYCRPTNCPVFFYFEVNRTGTGAQDGSANNIYVFFTQNTSVATSLNKYELLTSRSANSSLKSPQGSNPSYFYRQNTNFCRLCDYRCMKCFGPLNTQCTACVNHYFLWTTDTVCTNICPLGQYQLNISAPYPDNETKCANCDSNCIACVGTSSTCQVCVATSALIVNHDLCMTTFPSATDNVNCRRNNLCVDNVCPTNLYFWLPMSQLSNAAYPFVGYNATPVINQTNVCYLCHTYCKQCSDQYDNTCTACSYGYYLWQQYTTRCNYYCTEGQYTSGGLKGEFFNPLTSNTNRACATCSVGCQSCANSASECYTCQDDYFLLDDKTQCLSKFTCPLCVDPTYATDGCASNDKYCRPTNCPVFFYFEVNRTGTGAQDGSANNIYVFFTQNTSVATSLNKYELLTSRSANSSLKSPQGSNPSYFYRQNTNFCRLCDYRCMKCFGPLNTQCTACVNHYFLWTTDTVCTNICPLGQYQLNISAPYPDNETKCANCDSNCIACVGTSSTCQVCVATSALIVNHDLCMTTFPSATDNVNCRRNNLCVDNVCPTNLYFWLPMSQLSNAAYPFVGYNATPVINQTNVCYLCHTYCKQCSDQYDNTCTACSYGYYLWQQYTTRCNYYCTEGQYTSGGLKGEFFNPLTSNTNRACATCSVGCQSCANSASECYTCQDDYFLLDDKTQCLSKFTCPLCVDPTYATDGCASNDKYCRPTNCPVFFYFEVNRTGTGAQDGSANNIYVFFTQNTSVATSLNKYELLTSRSANSSLKSPQGSNPSYFYRQNTNFCRLCDYRCMKCFGPLNTQCTACVNHYFLWTTDTVCTNICPLGQYQLNISAPYPDNETKCANCDSNCIACVGTSSTCQVCVATSALIVNHDLCMTTFPSATDNVNCRRNNLCVDNVCPTNLYFWLPMSQLSNAAYPFVGYNATPVINQTNVCYLCHTYCKQCSDQYDNTCTACSYGYYLWQQYTTRCNYYCTEGQYTSGGLKGEFFNPLTSNTNRACATCSVGCQSCANSASECYTCQDDYFLLDDKTQCLSKFTCPLCVDPTYATDGCASNDKYCRPTNCPVFFYFEVNRTGTGAQDGSANNIYVFFTQNTSVATSLNKYELLTSRSANSSLKSPQGSNPSYFYRQNTNFCRLCDYRCMKCFGPLNTQCTACINKFFLWTNDTVCTNFCPTGQFQLNISSSYPNNQTKCANCDSNCIACIGYSFNCTSCQPYPSAHYGFLLTYQPMNSTCILTCPNSSTPNFTKGQYGSISGMICYSCPGQCSNCNIDLVMNIALYPQLRPIVCGSDYLCSKGIQCTSCLQGYSLVSGQCVNQYTCQLYSYYQKGNTSSAWSPSNCKCLNGYYFSSTINCSPCDISCLTCSGPSSSNCLTCSQGFSMFASTCSSTNAGSQVNSSMIWSSTSNFNTTFSTNAPTDLNYCGSYYTLFGYKSAVLSSSSTFVYTTDTLSIPNYYGISFKIQVLFIDNWDGTGGLYFALDSGPNPFFAYMYNNFGAIGQQQCGTNLNDYMMVIQGAVSLTPSANEVHTITINSNVNPITNSSGFYYYWGIKAAQFTVLQCHSDCSTCTGPNLNQCTSCSSSSKILVGSSCICNVILNYFYVVGSNTTCQVGCPYCISAINASLCYYRDFLTAKCVNPPIANCSAPNVYGDNDQINNFYGTCVQSCGSGLYAVQSQMKCTASCSTFNLSNYRGGATMWTCRATCPNGLIADPSTSSCVTVCPSTPTRYFSRLQNRTSNPTCVTNCSTGYEYDNLNQCVVSCPAGYYTQTINGHNKCVASCTNSFGDNVTQSCVTFCPSPSLADPTRNLCVNQCPLSYYPQVTVLNGNRTCVSQCQLGQWLNPIFLNCSNNPFNCPVGTFADNSTHVCEFQCTNYGQVGENTTRMCQTSCTTGYAYWDIGLCVKTCNNTMFGYASGSTRQCVANCNPTVTNMYGDAQANRTCVAKCSAIPVATFGDIITGLCVKQCSISNQFGDPYNPSRLCVYNCSSFPVQTFAFYLTKMCLTTCPQGYYGDNYTSLSIGVCSTSCPNGYYGDPTVNLCVTRCPFKYFGLGINGRPCLQICPDSYYATNSTTNRVCSLACDTGYWADNYTRTCYNIKKMCSNNTYADAQKKLCVVGTNCTAGTYADPLTMGCETNCSSSLYFGNPATNLCQKMCPTNPDYYSQNGFCTDNCNGGFFADYQANRSCKAKCTNSPVSLYGTSTFRCVEASLCGVGLFGDNVTQLCNTCSGTLPYGDSISFQCVKNCPLTYYGDIHIHLCVQQCNATINQFADNFTGTCTTLCTLGTFGVNSSLSPACQNSCPPNSFAFDVTRICVFNCGTGYYGDKITGKCYNSSLNCSSGYYGNSVTNMCVLPIYCQTVGTLHYYADDITKMCIDKCTSPNYGLNSSWLCVPKCPNPYFAVNNTRMCDVSSSCGIFGSFADSQINVCVLNCSTAPVFTFAENIYYTCVTPINCPTSMRAENISQKCVYYCPINSSYVSYADSYKSNYCVAKCPDQYYGDTSSGYGLCVPICLNASYFRDNSSQLCVTVCPAANSTRGTLDTFGDNTTCMCVITCPFGYFAQAETDRICVRSCMAGTWGNLVTRICINNPLNCPTGTWADSFSNLCTNICNSNSSNSQPFYGYNNTKMCVPSCPVPTFAYGITKVCIDICPLTIYNSPGLFGDPGTTPTRLCVSNCLTSSLYRDTANNRTCQPYCTYNLSYKTYRDPTTMTCVASCPKYPQFLYAWASNSTNSICTSTCPTGYMNDANQSCVASCSSLLDPTTNRCVQICPYNSINNTLLYSNLNTKTCVSALMCPTDTYASDDLLACVSTCPNNTYIYLKNCVTFCPNGFYINPLNQSCVIALSCPTNYFANNQTQSCVLSCTNGTYGYSVTKICLPQCYNNSYGDPNTGLCSSSCSGGQIKDNLTLMCVGDCETDYFYNPASSSCTTTCQSPYFANSQSRSCVLVCTSNPMTFASISPIRACVTTCPSNASWFDLINRICTTSCPNGTYQYSVNTSCVSFCPPPYYLLGAKCVLNCSQNSQTLQYADDTTQTCVGTCPTGYFKNPTTFQCVTKCPINPVRYYANINSKICVTNCTTNFYADNDLGACVSQCSQRPMTYAQPNTLTCVKICPAKYNEFADPTTQKCVERCPNGYFADNRERKCLKNCSNLYFADPTEYPTCVSSCPDPYFADPLLFVCATSCSPSFYAFSPNRTCIQSCPYGYFADPHSKYCEPQCQHSPYYYADNLTKTCLSNCSNNQFGYKPITQTYGICVYVCPSGYFSDPITMMCVLKCPNGYYGSTINNTCNLDCQENKFKDSVNNLCQTTCPSANQLFGDPFSRSCVLTCNNSLQLFADTNISKCVSTCSGNQFGDPATGKCVSVTSCSSGTLADPKYKLCVSRCYNDTFAYAGACYSACPNAYLFADEKNQSCVSAFSCSNGYFADSASGRCVLFCDINSTGFADIDSGMCLPGCNSPLFADNITRTCANSCPSVPLYYGINSTRICVQYCPSDTFGDPSLNLCVLKCSNGSFGDSSTWTCLSQCPYGTYGDNTTNLCVNQCPTPSYYGDPIKGICVFSCSQGLFADTLSNRQCQQTCSNLQFSENSTRKCVTFCLTGFADPISRKCKAKCPSGYYGHNFVCYQYQCPTNTPIIYADDTTNLCVTRCPNKTYGDLSTRKCLLLCTKSLNQYADTTNNVCTSSCPSTYGDPSTGFCVTSCPSIPSLFSIITGICVANCTNGLFADNSTRSCIQTCLNGTFGDNTTYTCVTFCPTKPMMYADTNAHKCVYFCSLSYDEYADNSSRTCVRTCPNGTFADPVSRSCKTTCQLGYFGVNSTKRCETGCLSPTFADSLLRLCVSKCSIDPIFYGDPLLKRCVNSCSSSYGNPLTQECVYNSGVNSTCPNQYFADPTSKLCVQVCPMKNNLYGDPLTKICKTPCPSSYFADNSTMRCVLVCPSYPNYFASNGQCVKYCPVNTFADNSTRVCVTNCPNNTFADNSTWTCVSSCSHYLPTFRDPVTWKCVYNCSLNYFADHISLSCVAVCPNNTYARNDTRQCVRTCPLSTYADLPSRVCVSICYNNTFADNTTRMCVETCPRYPPLYADTSSKQCVSLCTLGAYAFDDTRQCVSTCPSLEFYRQVSSRSCVRTCNLAENTFTDNFTGNCVSICSANSFADPISRRCVAICPDQPMLYANNNTQSCVPVCPPNLFGQNKTRTCVSNCPNGSISFSDTRLCVFECPSGYYAYSVTNFCVQTCPSPYFADPSSIKCVSKCPLNQLLYADNISRTCVKSCPSGSYSYQWSIGCLKTCPIAVPPFIQTYAADYDNSCVVQCAYPFYSLDLTFKCVSSCPNPYYNDLATHQCLLCPSLCISCVGLNACTNCTSGYFLENGKCVSSCQKLYYANPFIKQCVVSYLCKPYFGDNSTKFCSISCNNGSYANTNVYRCDACPSSCITCQSLTKCSSCIPQSILTNNYCYAFCNTTNITLMYFSLDNTTCLSQCPNGTYAKIVFCKLCDSVCTTCSKSAKNCTSCSNGFYLFGNSCVTTCPKQYKPATGLVCVFCNTTCGEGLTYSTNVTNINGQTSIFMNFNNAFNVSGNLYQTFGVTTGTRRLLADSSTPAYQIIMVDSQTIQIVFPPGTSNSNFNVQINNPQNIMDSSGNLPASLTSSIQIDKSDIYSNSISNSPNNFPTYFIFLGIICVISFLFDIQLMRFLQLLYVHYFVWMNLPPVFIKVFYGLKYSTLYYLPKVFSVDNPVLRPKVPASIYNAIGDYNFLRNAGFAFTPLIIILFIWAMLKVLSVQQINRSKKLRLFCRALMENKFKYAVIIEWVHIFILNTVFFAFLQLRDYTIYDTFTQVSIIMAHLFICLFAIISILIAYKVLKFYRSHPKLSVNLRKATNLMLQEQEADHMSSANVFLSSNKKIDLTNLEYPKINNYNIFPFRCVYRYNKLSLLCPNVLYLRTFMLSIFISFLPTSTLQMGLSIPINVLSLYYFCKYRPFTFKFKGYRIKNYFVIYHEACLILFEILMFILAIKVQNNATPIEKQNFSYSIIYFLTFACTVSFVYHIFAILVYIYRKIWLIFIETDIFKKNFPEKYAQYQQEKNQGVKLVKSIDPKAKEALKKLIRGYKANKSLLRPSEKDKLNPHLPVKYKITYFDRMEESRSSISSSTMTRIQRKQMIKEIFNEKEESIKNEDEYEQVREQSERTQPEYEEYEEEIEIKAKDLQKYVINGKKLMKLRQSRQIEEV